MAEKRMFARTMIESDAFIELSIEARLLYYDLGMRADDEGFVGNPKSLMNLLGIKAQALNELEKKKFIIKFESGVVCIKHWRINNAQRKDRMKTTKYLDERNQLFIKENGAYTLDGNQLTTKWQPTDNQLATNMVGNWQPICPPRLDKIRLDKNRIDYVSSDKTKKIEEDEWEELTLS